MKPTVLKIAGAALGPLVISTIALLAAEQLPTVFSTVLNLFGYVFSFGVGMACVLTLPITREEKVYISVWYVPILLGFLFFYPLFLGGFLFGDCL